MKLLGADWIVIAAVILLVGTHATTNFLIKYYEDVAETVGVAEEVVLQMEANPVARWFFGIASFKLIYSYILAPGLLIGLWWFLRKKYYNDEIVLQSYAVALFAFFFLNFMNDFSILLGVLA